MSDNIALNKTTDASSYVLPYTSSKAVDGASTPVQRWLGSSAVSPSGAITPIWLRVDLGNFFWINRWVVRQMGSLGWSANYNLSDYKLQGSIDNVNWFDIDSVINNSANFTDRTVAPTKARWVRIYVTKGLRCNNNFASIADLELYAADPTSANLKGLTLSPGSLTPAFAGSTYAYTSSVGYDNSTITVTPTAEDSRATIKVNGTPVVSGQASAPISLNAGTANSITVEVTPFIGNPQIYTIAVTRASSPYLASIGGMPTLTPAFEKTTLSYSGTVPNSTSTLKITPAAEDSAATVNVTGTPVPAGQKITITLTTGVNNIGVIVTSAVGTDSRTYNFAITRQSQ